MPRIFSRQADERFIVQIRNQVRLGEDSEPEPDVALLRPREDCYITAYPGPVDVLLVVEVADGALVHDWEVKVDLYGKAGIPEVWALNLPEDCLEWYSEPSPEGYTRPGVCRRGERLAPRALPDLELAVEDLLPSPPGAIPIAPQSGPQSLV